MSQLMGYGKAIPVLAGKRGERDQKRTIAFNFEESRAAGGINRANHDSSVEPLNQRLKILPRLVT